MRSDKEYIQTIYEKYDRIKTSQKKDAFYSTRFSVAKPNLFKLVAGVLLVMGLSVSLVYATKVTYQKVWKEPNSYTFLTEEKQKQQEEKKTMKEYMVRVDVDKQSAESCISEEQVREIAQKMLKKFDYEKVKIVAIKLIKRPITDQIEWIVATNGNVGMRINAITGEFIAFWTTTEGIDIVNNRSTKKEAIQVAEKFCEEYKTTQSEYQLVRLNGNAEKAEDVYIWYAEFQKKYGELLNPYEKISMAWIPNINKLYQLSIEQSPYEHNPLEIQKEEAIQRAKSKGKQMQGDLPIKEIQTELRIEKPNRTENEEVTKKDSICVYYEEEESTRLMWVVCIGYWSEQQQKVKYYSYYVDATTGEVTGGYSYHYFEREKIINNERKEEESENE